MSLSHGEPGAGPARLYKTADAAAYLGLGPSTLARWRHEGHGPEYVKMGACVRYAQAALDAFAAEGARRSTSEYDAA